MNGNPQLIIRQLRTLTPKRALELHEARAIAERQAIKLLQLLSQQEPTVDVGLIADLPRVEVKVAPNLHAGGVSGFSQWSRGRWLIVVNRDDSTTRRRFTLSHEFKHVLDHPFAATIYRQLGSTQDERDRLVERICDYFAGCLLVPRTWLKRAWANGVQDQTALAAMFNVSRAAMAVRLQQVGLVRPRTGHGLPDMAQPIRSYFRTTVVTQPACGLTA